MPDVFDDNAPVIVDGDVIEAAKENIQPLAAGRRVTALAGILSTPHAQREGRLAAARTRHRMNVEIALEDEDDDPLEAYCRFVYWTVENYPQGHSAESGLLELLEEATRVLKDEGGGRWRGDLRYLKLWVLYAGYVEKPAVIYKFLEVNEIGTGHALLYEEFAAVLERAGRRAEADDIYLLGIARRAAPLERLENKHAEFQKRMMASPTLPSAPPSEPASAGPSSSNTKRRVLGETLSSSESRTRSTRSGSTRNPSVSEDVFAAPPVARPNARMPVFVDPSGPDASENADPSDPSPWPELGTRKARVKENIVETSKMAGTTLRQPGRSHRVTSSASGSRMTVFRDPGPGDGTDEMPPPAVPATKKEKAKAAPKASLTIFRDEAPVAKDEPPVPSTPKFVPFRDEEPPTPSSSNSAVPGSVMKVKPKTGPSMSSEAEALRKDPLKNYAADERPAED